MFVEYISIISIYPTLYPTVNNVNDYSEYIH